jgi:hypothetical protein
MKKLLITLTAAVALAASAGAFAHGTKPKHGGVVQTASDLLFELVTKGDTATIYVEDHGKQFATAGASGKLTVLNGKEKSEAPLQPVGENTLEAKGVSKLTAGAKAVATITFADKKTVNARFTIK